MAVLLHAYLNIKDLSAIVNIAWGRVVLPVRLTVTGSGVVVTTPKSCKIVSPDGKSRASVPPDFLVNHISGSFVEMVLWWIQGRMRQTPEELDGYFRAVIAPLL